MIITNPLPLRVCSRCVNWRGMYAAPEDGRQKALCLVTNKQTYGSDSCIKWEKPE